MVGSSYKFEVDAEGVERTGYHFAVRKSKAEQFCCGNYAL